MAASTYIVILTFAAGLCMTLGGLLASYGHIRRFWLEQELRHFLIALGGGLLLGAVYQVLLPEGMEMVGDSFLAVALFAGGGFLFFLIERAMGLRRRETPQLLGMLLDYIPESIALGGLVVANPALALTLAIVIGLQNIPEGFNAFRELTDSGIGRRRVLWIMLSLTPTGPVAGLAAYYFLMDAPLVLGGIMLAAAGGIMYLMFQEIAPQSRLQRHWAPPLGAVIGFALTMLTDLLIDA